MTRTLIAALLLLCCQALPLRGQAPQKFVSAAVDQAGDLRIVAADGVATTIRKEPGEVRVADVRISAAGDAVGWVGMQKSCCTSYDVPTSLYVHTAGHTRKYEGNRLPVWRWAFSATGREVFFSQGTVHGATGEHYELRDVATGRLISEYTAAVGRDNQPLANQVIPEWVKVFMSLDPKSLPPNP